MADKYDWHNPKAETNAKKHGITFEMACAVFEDEKAVWGEDPDSSWSEDRFRIVGRVNGRFIAISYTYVDDDVVWLISARPATKREINDYYLGQTPT